MQKAVVAFKQLNKGSFSSVLKPQASKATSNSTSDSSHRMHNSSPENTRMRSTSQTTNHSSGSKANKAFSRSSTARTVHTSATNSSISRGLSIELSLPTTPSSSCHNVGSVSSSLTICPVESVMNGDEASSSTSSLMAVDANKIHTTNSKSSFDSVNPEEDSCISHISKSSINNHAVPTSCKGNNSENSPGNRTGAKSGKPSSPIVPHSKLANSDVVIMSNPGLLHFFFMAIYSFLSWFLSWICRRNPPTATLELFHRLANSPNLQIRVMQQTKQNRPCPDMPDLQLGTRSRMVIHGLLLRPALRAWNPYHLSSLSPVAPSALNSFAVVYVT